MPLCNLHGMTVEERQQHARRGGLAARRSHVDLVPMRSPGDAMENVRRIQDAMARGRLGERLARCHLLAIKLYLEAHAAEIVDAKAAEDRVKAEAMKRHMAKLGFSDDL